MKKATASYSRGKKSTTSSTMSELASQKKSGGSSEAIFAALVGFDEHERHHRNSSTIGHALITQTDSGEYESTQYAISQLPDSHVAVVREMTHIQKVEKGRVSWFRAKDTEGRKYISRRRLKLELQDKNGDEKESTLHYFSPFEYSSSEESEFSDDEPMALLRDNLTSAERYALEQIPHKVKSSTVVLVPDHVRQRDENPARTITQNDVMGESAKKAYENLLERFKDLLSPKLILILKRAIEANIFISPENECRPEWLHKIAHSLSPISNKKEHDPQQKSNLGAAGKWANTEMMLLERIGKWFSLSEEGATVTLTSLFEMLFGSEVIHKIHFEVRVDFKERFIRFIQDIDVFKEYPSFRKTSDLAQTIAITDAIFSDSPQVRTERVSVVSSSQPIPEIVAWRSPEEACESESEDTMRALRILSSHPLFSVCKRIQDRFPIIIPEEPYYIVTIVDTETSGLDASENELIELAMLSFAVSKTKGFLGIVSTYEGLSQPKVPVSSDITRITGITNEQLEGQTIQWGRVREILSRTKYVVCHNTRFDRAFLEQQTPEDIQERVKSMQFACTLEDINWYVRGYDPRKLDYLNFKLGYFYEAHRALNDCFATLNLLRNVPGAFDELIYNAHKKHMYFFSNRLIGSKSAAPMPKVEGAEAYEMPTQCEANDAYAILSALPHYKIYKAVPILLPSADSLGTEHPFITIVDLKTTGNDYLEDQITEVSMLSFSMMDGHVVVTDSFKDIASTEHSIDWGKAVAMLNRTQYLLSHKNNINRKFLECSAPPEVRRIVQSLSCASTALDIDWKKWSAANNSLKYLSFVFGYYFDPDCLMSQNCATLNLLQVVPGAFEELLSSLVKRQTVILLTGPFCSAINRELKSKGFQWSTGSGRMGKGWWACVDYDDTGDMMKWLLEAKEQAPGKNEIYFKVITPCERYSVRAEFKAAEMKMAGKKIAKKRPLEEDALSCSGPK